MLQQILCWLALYQIGGKTEIKKIWKKLDTVGKIIYGLIAGLNQCISAVIAETHYRFFLFVCFCLSITGCYSEPCKTCPEYIQGYLQYKTHYSFIQYQHNYWQWKDINVIQPFFEKLKKADNQKVKIVHIGDSHVQADIFTGYARSRLQEIFGNGGRGMVFPYAAARTHATADYLTYVTGRWDYAKNIHHEPKLSLGLVGVTAKTQDPRASFRISFYPNTAKTAKTLLKIYRPQPAAGSFVLNLKTDPSEVPQKIYLDTADTALPYVRVIFNKPVEWIEGTFSAENGGNFFETYGFSLENLDNSGVLYHSVGINGAGLYSILRQNLMDAQIAEIQPDLVIIDLGANDYFTGTINESEYEQNLKVIIQRIREVSPNTSFVISCSQDIYRYRYNIEDCEVAAKIAQRVAFESGCVFYDYYNVAGGKTAMLKWESHHLAKKDRVHLTNEGYMSKGELFTNALLTSYYAYLKGDTQVKIRIFEEIAKDSTDTTTHSAGADSLSVRVSFAGQATDKPTPLYVNPYINTATYIARTTRSTTHIVQPGDNLGAIAQKYKVSIKNIMLWNNLRNTMIFPKQKLVIQLPPVNQYQPRNSTDHITLKNSPKPAHTPNKKATLSPPQKYTVKSGDNLWSIAKRYGTTVEKIQKANPGIGNILRPGKVILIP